MTICGPCEVLARRSALALDNARLYRETREAVAARDRFLSIAAHEFGRRDQHAGLRPTGAAAARAGPDIAPALVESTIAAIERGTARLNTLVDDLLDVARLQAGLLRSNAPRSTSSRCSIGLSARRRPNSRPNCGSRSPLASSYPIHGDAGRLEQVLGNLLENARKYSPDGGTIAVALLADERGATITVRDEGLGLGAGGSAAVHPFQPHGGGVAAAGISGPRPRVGDLPRDCRGAWRYTGSSERGLRSRDDLHPLAPGLVRPCPTRVVRRRCQWLNSKARER